MGLDILIGSLGHMACISTGILAWFIAALGTVVPESTMESKPLSRVGLGAMFFLPGSGK